MEKSNPTPDETKSGVTIHQHDLIKIVQPGGNRLYTVNEVTPQMIEASSVSNLNDKIKILLLKPATMPG